MDILAAFLVLNVAAFVTLSEQLACSDTVQCPCGSSGKNVTVCAADAKDDLCSRWSKCLTCQDGLDRCLECKDDRGDGSCSPETGQPKLSRQKRQNFRTIYVANPRRPPNNRYQQRPNQGYPTGPVQQGGGFCPELSSPKLGSIRCLSNNQARTCVGRCLPGYSFENRGPEYEITLTCTDGYYTPLREFPPCKSGGYCDLIVQGSGSFNCTTGMDGTRCDIICNGRYVGRYFCYPGRPWQPNLPHCMRPKVTENCQCQYGGRCDSDGDCVCPVGRTGRNCEIIVVEKQTCSDPGFVTNGIRHYPDESDASVRRMFDEGDSVVYGCTSEEYALQGSSLLTCKSDGTWSKPLPKCVRTAKKQTCPDPGFVTNGFRHYPDESDASVRRIFDEGDSVVYGCTSEEYALQGSSLLSCKSDGTWSKPLPKCVKTVASPDRSLAFCRDPGTPANGSRRPQAPPNRRGFPQGTQLLYFCNQGFDLEGDTSLFCLVSGRWSSERPKCNTQYREPVAENFCLNPGSISNGKIAYNPPPNSPRINQISADTEFPEGGRLQFSCNSGYVMEGTATLTCLPDGWSAPAPLCSKDIVIYCPNPGRMINGKIAYYPPLNSRKKEQGSAELEDPQFPEGGKLQYTCDPGYVMKGSESLTCQPNGRWSASPPSCKKELIYCPNPGHISNGKIAYHPPINSRNRGQDTVEMDDPEFPEGSRLHYICDRDYVLEGAESMTCQSNGRWSASPPSCGKEITYCPNPGNIPNGKVAYLPPIDRRRVESISSPDFPEGGRLQYSCDGKYTLVGSVTLTCQANGDWSAEKPTCREASSPSSRTFYCYNPGPILNGRVVPVVPSSSRSPGAEDEEYPRGTRLQYSCDIGYSLQGSASITCGTRGQWSADPPICITTDPKNMQYCVNPGPILNGQIRYFNSMARPRTGSTSLVAEDAPEFPEGTRLEYQCGDNYIMEGAFQLKCQSTGQWSDLPPKCVADCGRSIIGTTRRILHGNKTVVGEWPWVVAIGVRQNNYTRLICAGAVLNTQTIITAAHCLEEANKFVLYFGKYHRSDSLDDGQVQVRTSDRLIKHPEYSNVTMDNDIALVKFKRKINFTDRIQPICLPSAESTTYNLVSGRSGYVTGWGWTEKRLTSDELLVAHLPYVSNNDCISSFRRNVENFNGSLTQNMFCAGYKESNSQATCRGDSGAPFVFYDTLVERYTLEGLVSFGVEGQCGRPGMYSVFTKVYRFLPWIYRNL